MENSWFTIAAITFVALYCVVQAVRDIRAKRYIWAAAAGISAALLLTMPVQTHAVKIDLPMAEGDAG